ncbi:hypothetical protein AGMMS49944_21690 [Spirochaetia bacterium]|nr:hypothetical protein AGMMS49944_21690 [Spirochaetia bacterium]
MCDRFIEAVDEKLRLIWEEGRSEDLEEAVAEALAEGRAGGLAEGLAEAQKEALELVKRGYTAEQIIAELSVKNEEKCSHELAVLG